MVRRILSGDEQAFRRLMDRYRGYLFGVVYSILRHAKDAEDITQEALVQIYLSLPQYRSKGLKSWMTRIAVNKAIDHKRRLMRKKEELSAAIEVDFAPSLVEPDVSTQVLRAESREEVQEKLDQLPAHYREVLVAYYMEGKSYREIAGQLGIEERTVATRLHRARKLMRQQWQEEDG